MLASDQHWAVHQLGMITLFDRGIESVHIDMNNSSTAEIAEIAEAGHLRDFKLESDFTAGEAT